MPALTTHKIFAEQIQNELKLNNIDDQTYYIFSQSHDLLYYYKGKNYKFYNKQGTKGHHKSTQDFIINIIECIKSNSLTNDKQCMAYLYGTLTHYYLDSTTHPYVFYKSGVFRKYNKDTYKYRGQHNLLERSLDSVIYEKTYNKKYKNCKTHKEIIPKIEFSKNLTTLIDLAYNKTYKTNNMSKYVIKGYNTMRLFHKLVVNDSLSIKYYLYKLIDFISNNKTKCLHSYTTSVKCTDSILNLEKKNWYNPTDKSIKYNTSFIDLMNNAKKDCIKTIKKINAYLYEDKEIDLKELIKDLDYSTGLLIKDNKEIRHFEYWNVFF